jgi:hypothetical protein
MKSRCSLVPAQWAHCRHVQQPSPPPHLDSHSLLPPQDLEYLNLALNNITKLQNLQRCESLQKLDLTVNFVPKAGLLSLPSLTGNYNLRELYLTGNPCTDWEGYRPYVIATLLQLQKLVRGTRSWTWLWLRA